MKAILSRLLNADFINKNYYVLIILLITCILFFLPTGFGTNLYPNSTRAKAQVMSVDNSTMSQVGIVRHGEQVCSVKILNGRFKGQEARSVNRLMGQLEFDKVFQPGDKALVVIDYTGGTINFVNIIDHYRINLEFILFAAFILLLVIFAGWTGLKSVISFIFTVLMIWKILIPAFLRGYNPIAVAFLIVTIITVTTILLVTGYNRKSLVAILGSVSGSLVTCILAVIFTSGFKIHGAVLSFSETLLYSGYSNLNLTQVFIASIFLASTGALMDVAVDISASVHELVEKKPDITAKEATKSGFTIGRAVLGTMSTTLLLAYSGSYIGMLMVFMAQGTPTINILNLKYVSSEILHTIVGSFGLVAVAPLTAILAGIFFTRNKIDGCNEVT